MCDQAKGEGREKAKGGRRGMAPGVAALAES